jgi:hypothetical protein
MGAKQLLVKTGCMKISERLIERRDEVGTDREEAEKRRTARGSLSGPYDYATNNVGVPVSNLSLVTFGIPSSLHTKRRVGTEKPSKPPPAG